KIIPIRRGEVDLEAMRTLLESLKDGWILGIAPEGTRNRTGELIRAQAGIAVLAQKSGAPLQALAHWVDKPARRFLGFFPRPVFHIRVGEAFRLAPSKGRVSKDDRQEIADQIMYQLARLLPEKMRGVYASPSEAPHTRLAFEAEEQ
ncbi:MAG: lysophospholipid acyltransferase family protein, partial [Spirochaetaceae bacterium]|nr:lysophospholipid acyltransferase family protein [Spirochaetaceae bacterium]